MTKERQVFLLTTHTFNDEILVRYLDLKKSISSQDKVFLLIHHEEELYGKLCIPNEVQYFQFDIDSLNSLKYNPICETITPGSNHFPLFLFYLTYPSYDYYWNIEYDVVFAGQWCNFFSVCNAMKTDFMTCHIRKYNEEPNWFWWHTLKTNLNISQDCFLRSFNPIYKMSSKALLFLHHFLYNSENEGHHEVLLPTILYQSGFDIADFGGNGTFVPEGFHNKFYIDENNAEGVLYTGTMRYRPPFHKPDFENNKLYHPIKLNQR